MALDDPDGTPQRLALGSGLDALPTELHRLVLTLNLSSKFIAAKNKTGRRR